MIFFFLSQCFNSFFVFSYYYLRALITPPCDVEAASVRVTVTDVLPVSVTALGHIIEVMMNHYLCALPTHSNNLHKSSFLRISQSLLQ